MPAGNQKLTRLAVVVGPLRIAGQRLSGFLHSEQFARLRRPLELGINVLLVAIVAALVYQNRELLPIVARLVSPWMIGVCLLLYLFSLLLQSFVWMNLMGYPSAERGTALAEYIRTIFMGWLPGGLWKLVGRMTVYRPKRLSSANVLAVNLIEVVLSLLANALLLIGISSTAWPMRAGGIALLALGPTLLAPSLSGRLPSLLEHRSPARWLAWLISYVLSWLSGGMITYLVIAPFGPQGGLVEALRLWCIAGGAGVILQILPFSMLARDATLVVLLRSSLPLDKAIVAAFAVRLTMMACELVAGWALLALIRLVKRDVVT